MHTPYHAPEFSDENLIFLAFILLCVSKNKRIENVERLKKCKTPKNGYKTYKCPECGTIKYVPFTCKCRLCTSCGTKAANEWADKIHHMLLKVPHRHVIFTIPDILKIMRKDSL
jgi:hypothetical protein